MVPIFKGKGDIGNSSCYWAVNLHEQGMTVVESVMEKWLRWIVSVDEMLFGSMPERGTIDAVFILRRMQEEFHAKGKQLYMCFVNLEKSFDIVPSKVLELAMRKKGIPDVLARSVMSMYVGAKTRVRVDLSCQTSFVTILRIKGNSVLCVQCGKWIHGRFAGVKRVTPKFSRNFTCIKCEGNIGETVGQEETLCDEVETEIELTYLVDMVSAGGGCEAAVTARIRCGWVKFRVFGEFLDGRKFSLKLEGSVYNG